MYAQLALHVQYVGGSRESCQPNRCLTDYYLMYIASIKLPYFWAQQGPPLSDLHISMFYDLCRWKTCSDSIFNASVQWYVFSLHMLSAENNTMIASDYIIFTRLKDLLVWWLLLLAYISPPRECFFLEIISKWEDIVRGSTEMTTVHLISLTPSHLMFCNLLSYTQCGGIALIYLQFFFLCFYFSYSLLIIYSL